MTKFDAESGIGYGVLAEEALDKSGEIFDYETSKPHVKAWSDAFQKATDGKSAGNLRAMHGNVAAGKFLEVGFDDAKKQIPVTFKVVDAAEREKCAEGVYTGLSIGGEYVKRWKPEGSDTYRYTAKLAEGSLVDNPCIPGATFQYIRAAGVAPELRKFKSGDPQSNAAPNPAPAGDPEDLLSKFTPAELQKLAERLKPLLKAEMAIAEEQPDTPAPDASAADPAAVATQAAAVLDQVKALLAQAALLAGDPATWSLRELVSAMEALTGMKWEAEYRARMDEEAIARAVEASLKKHIEPITTSVTDALAKVATAVEAKAQETAAEKDSLAKALPESVAKAVESATGDLRKAIDDLKGLPERVDKLESQPAEVGHPTQRVHKALGSDAGGANNRGPSAADVRKFIDEARTSGQLSQSAAQELSLLAAAKFMP